MKKPVIGICGYMQNGKDTTADILIEKMSQEAKFLPKWMVRSNGKSYTGSKYSFADALKKLCSVAFDLNLSSFYSEHQKTQSVELCLDPDVIASRINGWVTEYIFNSKKWAYIARENSISKERYPYQLAQVIHDAFSLDNEVNPVVKNYTIDIKDESLMYPPVKTRYVFKTTIRRIAQLMGTEVVRNNIHDDFWVEIKAGEFAFMNTDYFVVPDVRFPNEADYVDYLIRVIDPRKNNNHTHASESHIKNFKVDFDIVNDGSLKDLEKKVDKIASFLKGDFSNG